MATDNTLRQWWRVKKIALTLKGGMETYPEVFRRIPRLVSLSTVRATLKAGDASEKKIIALEAKIQKEKAKFGKLVRGNQQKIVNSEKVAKVRTRVEFPKAYKKIWGKK